MILDTLERLSLYIGVHPLVLPTAIWLADATHHGIADGRHELAPGLVVMVETATTHPASTRRYESHRENIDIQVNLSGGEIMEWTPVAGLTVADDFQPDGDIAFYHEPAQPGSRLLVMPGMFTLFLPGDAHKPVLHPFGQPVTYRKMVFKLRV